jgi:hypothetical protein
MRLAAVCAALPAARTARAETALVGPDDEPTLLVAGPADSRTADWARLLRLPLTNNLTTAGALRLRFAGGLDGVTGANHFEAQAMPDGSQALLFPGSAALAWMAGDSRVRFEMDHLMPLAALATTDVVMLRGGLDAVARKAPLRLPCGTAPEPALTALMALDMLGIAAVTVPPLPDPAACIRAGTADAVFLSGDDVPGQIEAMRGAGLEPGFITGLRPHGELPAGHPLQGVPHLLSLVEPARRGADPLVAAWRSVAASSSLEVVLALPRVSTAPAITDWRQACAAGLATPSMQQQFSRRSVRLLSDAEASGVLAIVRGDAAAQAALRRWLSARVNWRPA